MPADMSQIPPQMLQALQQQQQAGASGVNIGDMLQQLMQMSPDEVATVLQQMGIQVTPEQVQTAAENWVDQAADDASGNKATPNTPNTPDNEGSEPTPDSEPAEGEQAPAQDDEAAEPTPDNETAEGETAMPSRGMPSGAGGSMDDLVSAAMMQQAAGNPNAPVPTLRGVPTSPMRPNSVAPNVPTPRGGSGSGSDPRIAAVIANAYRANMARGVPQGPSATPSARRRRV
jgi:hypothetical protein